MRFLSKERVRCCIFCNCYRLRTVLLLLIRSPQKILQCENERDEESCMIRFYVTLRVEQVFPGRSFLKIFFQINGSQGTHQVLMLIRLSLVQKVENRQFLYNRTGHSTDVQLCFLILYMLRSILLVKSRQISSNKCLLES